ncbi:MAG: sigma-70 family RNA polymerase sigma factor [Myxococcales bacterium]|nr:sigma-70 family RNA polymerase sigma factor [Myxococcales bacterium]
MPDDENALLEAWKSGDRSAADRLCRRYWPDMLRFFLTATGGDEARAEELAQATFLTVLGRRDAIESSFRAYCYGVARHKRFEAARRWAAEQRHHAIDEGELVLEAPPPASEEDRQRGMLAISVLRRLEPDEQLVLVLKDYLGFSQPELAETFQIPQSRVSGRINRARQRFRREFERLELRPEERELTLRSLSSALASIVARLPEELTGTRLAVR